MAERTETITQLICRIGRLPSLTPEQDFFEAGFESIGALELLLELETAFEVTIPDDRFVECRTVIAIDQLIAQLQSEHA